MLAAVKLGEGSVNAEWKAVEGSRYFGSPLLYKENGFKEKKSAAELILQLGGKPGADENSFTAEHVDFVKSSLYCHFKDDRLFAAVKEVGNMSIKFFLTAGNHVAETK